MGVKFQFGTVKNFQRWVVEMAAQQCKCTELYTLKMVKGKRITWKFYNLKII